MTASVPGSTHRTLTVGERMCSAFRRIAVIVVII